MKKENGITLIALIITIIVMLILVGVSVTVALNGGLFNTAKNAAKQTQIQKDKEQLLSTTIGAMKNDGTVDFEKLDEAIQEIEFEGSNGTYIKNGEKYFVTEYGNIKDNTLPNEYQKVEYIENTSGSSSYILPNIDWNEYEGDIKINVTLLSKYPEGNILKIPMEKVTRFFISSWRPYIAIENEKEGNDYYTNRLWGVIAQSQTTITADFGSGILEAKNSSQSGRVTFTPTETESTGDMIFFAVKSILYDAELYADGRIVRNFIPCYTKTTINDANGTECQAGKVGLYDTVEGKFYINQGTGADFTAGPEI